MSGGVVQRWAGPRVPGLMAAVAASLLTAVGPSAALRGVVPVGRGFGGPTIWSGVARALVWLLTVGLVAVVWWLVGDRPAAGAGLAVMGLSWLLPGFASVTTLSPSVRAGLLAVAPMILAGIRAAALSFAQQGVRRRATTTGRAATVLAIGSGLAHLLGYSPFDDRACSRTCEPSPAPLATLFGARKALGLSVLLAVSAGAAVLVAVRSSGGPAALRWAATVATVAATAAMILPWWSWGTAGHAVLSDWLMAMAVAVLSAAVLIGEVRIRAVRRNVAALLDQLGEKHSNRPGRGPRLVHFTGPETAGWVDPDGVPVPSGQGDFLVLDDGSGPVARLALEPGERPGQVQAELTPAARMALDNARLDALARARLVELQASQRRIVAATDAERSRIGRDLHDGAQQRLVAVSLHLRAAGGRADPVTAAVLGEAARDVREAVEALRTLAHGVVPAVLFDEGLGVAVRELAALGPAPVAVAVEGPLGSVPEQVAVTAYLVAAAGLDNVARHSRADTAALTIAADRDTLTLRVIDDGVGGATLGTGLTEVADRVGALGGRMTVTGGSGGGTVLTVVLPCGS